MTRQAWHLPVDTGVGVVRFQYDHQPTKAEIDSAARVAPTLARLAAEMPPPTPEQLATRQRSRDRIARIRREGSSS